MTDDDFDKIFDTLRNENKQNLDLIEQIKRLFYSLNELNGLTLMGACRFLVKAHVEQKQKIDKLRAQVLGHENKKNK